MNPFHRAKEFRKNMTKAEVLLWKRLSSRKLYNYKFRRQTFIKGKYIADFYCPAERLIIEVDGLIHKLDSVQKNDVLRTKELNSNDYHVIRSSNEEVVKNPTHVLTEILRVLQSL